MYLHLNESKRKYSNIIYTSIQKPYSIIQIFKSIINKTVKTQLDSVPQESYRAKNNYGSQLIKNSGESQIFTSHSGGTRTESVNTVPDPTASDNRALLIIIL